MLAIPVKSHNVYLCTLLIPISHGVQMPRKEWQSRNVSHYACNAGEVGKLPLFALHLLSIKEMVISTLYRFTNAFRPCQEQYVVQLCLQKPFLTYTHSTSLL